MEYFEIIPDTKEHVSADKVFSWKKDWFKKDVLADFEQAIGIDPNDNMEMNPYILRLNNISMDLRNQFKKNLINGRFEAFTKSDINKRYLAVVAKHKLESYSMTEFAIHFGLGNINALCPIVTKDQHRFFLEMVPDIDEKKLIKFNDHPALSKISEYDYLILRANMVKEESENNE